MEMIAVRIVLRQLHILVEKQIGEPHHTSQSRYFSNFWGQFGLNGYA